MATQRTQLTQYIVKYCKYPTGHNQAHNAIVEAESPEIARKLVRQELGEGNGVWEYKVDRAKVYEPVATAGQVLTMKGDI